MSQRSYGHAYTACGERDLGSCPYLFSPHCLHQLVSYPVALSDAVSQSPALLEKRGRDRAPLSPKDWMRRFQLVNQTLVENASPGCVWAPDSLPSCRE